MLCQHVDRNNSMQAAKQTGPYPRQLRSVLLGHVCTSCICRPGLSSRARPYSGQHVQAAVIEGAKSSSLCSLCRLQRHNKPQQSLFSSQMLVQAASTEGSEEGPELWAVEAIAAPLVERVKLHFAPGRPTSRPDKPEWLLNTILQVCTLYRYPRLQPTMHKRCAWL